MTFSTANPMEPQMNQIDLIGKIAVVTGGAQGIGFAVARRLIASGASVSLWDMNEDLLKAAVRALGERASSVVVDISDHAAVAAEAEHVESGLGSLDTLVHSDGIAGPNAPTDLYAIYEWQQLLTI